MHTSSVQHRLSLLLHCSSVGLGWNNCCVRETPQAKWLLKYQSLLFECIPVAEKLSFVISAIWFTVNCNSTAEKGETGEWCSRSSLGQELCTLSLLPRYQEIPQRAAKTSLPLSSSHTVTRAYELGTQHLFLILDVQSANCALFFL